MSTITVITDVTTARRIASQWQSPGAVGSVIASFASGRTVGRYRLRDDITATMRSVPFGPDLDELDALRTWVETNDDHVLIGPRTIDGVRVFTNRRVREVLRWFDLTAKEREEFDYLDTHALQEEAQFVRYRGWVHDINDTDGLAPSGLASLGWDTYASDSFFSGTVFRFFDAEGSLIDGGDGVIVGRYVCHWEGITMNRPIIRRWTGGIVADNYDPPRSAYFVEAKVYAATAWSEETTVIEAEGIRDACSAVYLIDDGSTVTPMYVSGWQPSTGEVFLNPFPVNPDGKTRPDGRVIDYSTWQLGPKRCYHVKVTETHEIAHVPPAGITNGGSS